MRLKSVTAVAMRVLDALDVDTDSPDWPKDEFVLGRRIQSKRISERAPKPAEKPAAPHPMLVKAKATVAEAFAAQIRSLLDSSFRRRGAALGLIALSGTAVAGGTYAGPTRIVVMGPDMSHSYAASIGYEKVVDVTSTSSLVDKIIQASRGRRIERLVIDAHGRPGEQTAGADGYSPSISVDRLWQQLPELRRLAPYFTKDAVVTLGGCNTGYGEPGERLLRTLATNWQVTVQAGTEVQWPHLAGLEGEVVTCKPDGRCETTPDPSWFITADVINGFYESVSIALDLVSAE